MKDEGIYYKQGRLGYEPEQELVYNDRYKVPLATLLTDANVKSTKHIKALLDESGYVGRYKMWRVYKDNVYPLNQVKFRISLIWSELTYSWPLTGYFSMDYNKAIPERNQPAMPPGIATAVKILYKYQSASHILLANKLGCSAKETAPVVDRLYELGVLIDDRMRIVDDSELEEVIANILS